MKTRRPAPAGIPPAEAELQPALSGAWLSVRRAAERAGVSTRTIKRWIEKLYLSAARTPSPKGKGHLRIRVGDLEALLARGTLR